VAWADCADNIGVLVSVMLAKSEAVASSVIWSGALVKHKCKLDKIHGEHWISGD
jgi:hypothetical protein